MVQVMLAQRRHAYWDVELLIRGCEGLPRMDFVGHADPYVVLRVATPDGLQAFDYKTAVIYNTANPTFGEEVCLRNVPLGAIFSFQVIDKDRLTPDDPVGSCELIFDLDMASSASIEGGHQLRLPIQPAPRVPLNAGFLLLAVRCRPPCHPPGPCGPVRMVPHGPVRYRISTSQLAGAVTGHALDDGALAFSAYKLSLAALPTFFPGAANVHWNTSYDKARQVFGSTAMVHALKAQHALLYRDKGHQSGRGVLRGGGDLVALLRGGVRGGQRRFYTYVLMGDGSWYFSETGAAFFTDFMSKHAMHAGCAEKVVYAGEFCLATGGLAAAVEASLDAAADASAAATSRRPPPSVSAAQAAEATAALEGVAGEAAGDWVLLIDNNSGTYAPPVHRLHSLAALLEHNLPGLRVLALEHGDPRMVEHRAWVPSR